MFGIRVTLFLLIAAVAVVSSSMAEDKTLEALLSRAKALELNTSYVPPPGNALSHQAAGFAKVMCSAVFITGLDPEFAAESVGYFTAPYEVRSKLGKPQIDRDKKAVHVPVPGQETRTAIYLGDQGCVALPSGSDSVNFTPVKLKSTLPDAATQPWPMGDVLPSDPMPAGIDMKKVAEAVDAAFDPASMTTAFVVTWKGRIIGERYAKGITSQTPLESWSMGKSITATLMGILIQQGVYKLWDTAPIPEWQKDGDPRKKKSASAICFRCRVDFASARPSTPSSIRRGLIPITTIFTPARSTLFTTRQHDLCSGLRVPLGGIATPIPF